MSKVYDLEEKIMECWSILDQIDTTLQIVDRTSCNEDAISNALVGIKQLYQTKFEVLFETFEEVLRENHNKKLETIANNNYTTSTSNGTSTTIIFK
jgi:hypothetical protein